MIGIGMLLIISTIKRPTWLGGQRRRYDADDTAHAMLKRSSRTSLGSYLVLAGVVFWITGL